MKGPLIYTPILSPIALMEQNPIIAIQITATHAGKIARANAHHRGAADELLSTTEINALSYASGFMFK